MSSPTLILHIDVNEECTFSSANILDYTSIEKAFYAKESPIPPPDPITPPAILTPSPVLPSSLMFDPRYFFIPKELLPPKKQIHPPSSSSTTFLIHLGSKPVS
ncbi:hypothetical protein Tco_0798005 [Tanacetum coccineum]